MDERDHPAVRRGTRLFRGKGAYLALILIALGIVTLVRDLTAVPVLSAIGCFVGAGLSLWFGERLVKDLRHEYRYEDKDRPEVG
ncbi:hypothetical protein [Arthrobacter sp. MDT1-65]